MSDAELSAPSSAVGTRVPVGGLESGLNGPPRFAGTGVGSGLEQLTNHSALWAVTRVLTAPGLTHKILEVEPGFTRLPEQAIVAAANTLGFLFVHARTWTLLWAKSIPGPGHFEQTESVTYGVSTEQGIELARKVGLKADGGLDFTLGKIHAEASAEWSRLTRDTFKLETQRETSTTLSYDVPADGMDIALWRLDSQLTRRLVIRVGRQLPSDPLPAWVEAAVAARASQITVPLGITRAITRMVPAPQDW